MKIKLPLSCLIILTLITMSATFAMSSQEVVKVLNNKLQEHQIHKIDLQKNNEDSIKWHSLHGPFVGEQMQAIQLSHHPETFFAFRPFMKGQIYRSINAGKDWQELISPTNVILYDLAAIDDQRLLLGTNAGLYLSQDVGEHWKLIKTMSHSVNHILVANPNLILILTDRYLRSANLFRSINGGQEWTPARLGLNTSRSIWSISGKKDILFASANGLNVSTNGGQFWKQFAKWKNHPILSIAVNSRYAVYVATGELYQTDASGQSWEKINTGIEGDIENVQIDKHDRIYVVEKAINAKQAGLYRSTDEGKSWQLLQCFKRIDNFTLLENDKILLTTDKGLLLSNKEQSVFHLLSNKFAISAINDVLAIDKKHFYAIDTDSYWATLKNTLYRSNDGGKTWSPAYNGYVYSIVQFNNQLILVTQDNLILSSQDKGETWKKVYQFNDNHLPIGLSVQHNALVLLRTDGQYLSYNLFNWKKFNDKPYHYENDIIYINDMNWIYINADNSIKYSIDEGGSWISLLENIQANGLISGYHSQLIVAAFIEAGIIKSLDGGLTWEMINNGLGNFHFRKLKVMDKTHYYLVTDQGMYLTNDGGQNWTATNNGLVNKDILSLFINDNFLLVGTNGSGVFMGQK